MFRTDAKGTEDKVVLAGWTTAGNLDTKQAAWFSLTLSPAQIPWAFKAGKGSSWASSTLEKLATWIAVKLFTSDLASDSQLSAQVVFSGGTDNRANQALAKKRSSARFPLMFVMMQLAHTLSVANLRMKLGWRPRSENQEADDLTNDRFDKFNPSLRILVDWESLDKKVLTSLLAESEAFLVELDRSKDKRRKEHMSSSSFSRHIQKKRRELKTPWE
jgi:hypothetical protein